MQVCVSQGSHPLIHFEIYLNIRRKILSLHLTITIQVVAHNCGFYRLGDAAPRRRIQRQVHLRTRAALAIRVLLAAKLAHECAGLGVLLVVVRGDDDAGGDVVGRVGLVAAAVPFVSLASGTLSHNLGDQVGHHEFNIQLDDVCDGGELDVSVGRGVN